MDTLDAPTTEPEAPPGTRSTRRTVHTGLLGLAAVAAVTVAVVALTSMAGTTTAPAAKPAAPAVNLAALQQSSAQSLQALQGTTHSDMAPAAAPAAADAVQVTIQNFAFSPAALSIPAGTTVVWTNKDTAPHTVTVSSGPVKFSSPDLQTGDTFTYTFTQPGTYNYYCAIHPNMTASVTVAGGPTTNPPPPPTTTPAPPPTTTTMAMPPPPSGGATCLVSGVLTPLLQHINSAHLGESPGQQIQDLTNLNQYVLTHTTLIENMLNPLTNGGLVNVFNGVLTPLVQHIDSAHLGESPGQQAQDLLNVNQYVLTHTTLIENMIGPLEQATC